MKTSLLALLAVAAVGAGAGGLFAVSSQHATAPGRGPAPRPPAAAVHPVAVELFTSQGCSSCPPADAALERLARDRNVVALTRPVTYWDRLGWRDTLAREANTNLQRAYARRRHSDGVYTPEAVVQGGAGTVGSQEGELRRLIAAAARRPEPSLAIRAARGGRTVELSGARRGAATVTLIALRASVQVPIGRGENGGRTVRYTNVVIDERLLGRWSGGPMRLNIPAAELRTRGADRYAIVVQEADAGPILAVRYL